MLLGNVTRITWIIAMTQSGSRICGQVQISGQIWLGMNNSKSVDFRVVNTGQERGEVLQPSSEYLRSTTRNLQRNVEAITISIFPTNKPW